MVADTGGRVSDPPAAGPTVTETPEWRTLPLPIPAVSGGGQATARAASGTIEPGDWLVPAEVKPGTYRTEQIKKGGLCYVSQTR